MNISDKNILSLDIDALFSRDLLLSLLEIEEPEERERLEAILLVRAEQLGQKTEVRRVLKAFHTANDLIQNEYNRDQAKQRLEIALDVDATGKPVSSIDNFLMIIEGDEKFSGLKYNLLTYSPEHETAGITERWLDSDDAEARHYIEKKYRIHNQQKCDDALRIVFARNAYHPIRDLVDSFEWDGQERITNFLHFATKCDDTEYTREVSRLIFAGGINRLYRPGCKFDDMPVLIGRQGEGKSTLVRWLAMRDEYFAEVNEFDGQRGIEALEGGWICEVSELLAMTKTKDQEAVKSFLTRLNDRYRMPFDKRVTEHPRQCVFIGTTNKEQFLTDKTGNRRFYPVKVRQSGYELFDREKEIKDYIRQCWAEAKAKLMKGDMKPYANRNLLAVIRSKQSEATEDDYRVGMIEDYVADHEEVCILQLWREALDMGEFSKPTKKDSNDIALIMQSIDGWEKQDNAKRMFGYGVQKYWKKVGLANPKLEPENLKMVELGEDEELPF